MKNFSCKFILFTSLFILLNTVVTACGIIPASINSLAVGKLAAVHSDVKFSPNGLRNFNGLKKSDILSIRTNATLEHPEYISGKYVPSEAVFAQIEDGRPWWGLEGISFFHAGPKSSNGLTGHSQQICNPFILVVADIYQTVCRFDQSRFKNIEALAAAGCPTRCQPSQVSIKPELSQGSVTYDISEYVKQTNMFYSLPKITPADIGFSLQACNAKDFGYNYLYVDSSKSSVACNGTQQPIHLSQLFRCTDRCGMPGGCNDMVPSVAQLEDFKLAGLPARCHIFLWKEEPDNLKAKPDFTFDIEFK